MAIAIENKISNLLGVVLCGGKSVRMGTDKGLKMQNLTPWAIIVANLFKALNISYVVSINQNQTNNYLNYFKINTLIIDKQNKAGPLRGLLTVHQQHPNKNLLVLACDMVDMQQDTVKVLIDNYTVHPHFDFYAYHNGVFWEPFCGIYTSVGLTNLKHNDNCSIQNVLTSGLTQKNNILNLNSFKNYNTQ